jgi:hypothetical protein
MICGNKVSYELAMDEWGNLLDRGQLPKDQKKIAKVHLSGLKAEKNMAYYLDARFSGHPSLMVFNNLKVVDRDRTAQIDHLVLSRWGVYFIETKSVSWEININEDGQWSRVNWKKRYSMESPLEQSRRHESILFDLLESRASEFMGKFLGLQLKFRNLWLTHHVVGVSVDAKITGRGKKAVKDHLKPLDQVPQFILENHESVCGNLLTDRPDNDKRMPALSKKEFAACCQLLEEVDISETPLAQVHAFIADLPREAAALADPGPSLKAAPPVRAAEPAMPPAPEALKVPPVKTESPPVPPASAPLVESPPTGADAPTCAKCGSPMALRIAKRGERKGQPFYGCTQYPKCREIINID